MGRPSVTDPQPARRLVEGTPVILTTEVLATGVAGRIVVARPGQGLEITVADPDAAALGALVTGTRVEARFARPQDASYRFTTRVVATRLTGGEHRLVVSWPSTVDRLQARGNVRVALTLAMSLVPAGPRRLGDGGSSWVHGTVVDLSAGGVGVVTGERLRVGQPVLIRLDVPGRHADVHVDTRGTVVRRLPVPSRNELYHYGIEMLDLPPRVEQDLVQAVFHHLAGRIA